MTRDVYLRQQKAKAKSMPPLKRYVFKFAWWPITCPVTGKNFWLRSVCLYYQSEVCYSPVTRDYARPLVLREVLPL